MHQEDAETDTRKACRRGRPGRRLDSGSLPRLFRRLGLQEGRRPLDVKICLRWRSILFVRSLWATDMTLSSMRPFVNPVHMPDRQANFGLQRRHSLFPSGLGVLVLRETVPPGHHGAGYCWRWPDRPGGGRGTGLLVWLFRSVSDSDSLADPFKVLSRARLRSLSLF